MADDDDFESWYRREHRRLVNAIIVASGDVDLGREVADEAFARCLERWDGSRRPADLSAWTYLVAVNLLRRRWRRRNREHDLIVASGKRLAGGRMTGAPHFIELGGRPAVDIGTSEPIDGSALGLPDRVTHYYDVLIGGEMMYVGAENVPPEQLDAFAAALSVKPVDPGFELPDGVLPAGSQVIVQDHRSIRYSPDSLSTDRDVVLPGRTTATQYRLPGPRQQLVISVTSDVDAAARLAQVDALGFAGQQPRTTQISGHPALVPTDDSAPSSRSRRGNPACSWRLTRTPSSPSPTRAAYPTSPCRWPARSRSTGLRRSAKDPGPAGLIEGLSSAAHHQHLTRPRTCPLAPTLYSLRSKAGPTMGCCAQAAP